MKMAILNFVLICTVSVVAKAQLVACRGTGEHESERSQDCLDAQDGRLPYKTERSRMSIGHAVFFYEDKMEIPEDHQARIYRSPYIWDHLWITSLVNGSLPRMTLEGATEFCTKRGGYLPSQDSIDTLRKALTVYNYRVYNRRTNSVEVKSEFYNPNIPGTKEGVLPGVTSETNYFWVDDQKTPVIDIRTSQPPVAGEKVSRYLPVLCQMNAPALSNSSWGPKLHSGGGYR